MKPRQPAGRLTTTIEGHEFDKQDLVDEVEEALERVLEEGDDFATYEKTLMEITRDLVRSKLEKKLQAMSDQLAKRLWIDHDNPAWPLGRDRHEVSIPNACVRHGGLSQFGW